MAKIIDYVDSHFSQNTALTQKGIASEYLSTRRKTGLRFSEYEERLFKIFTMTSWYQPEVGTKGDEPTYKAASISEVRHELEQFYTSGSTTKKADEFKAIKNAEKDKKARLSKVFEIVCNARAKEGYLPKNIFGKSSTQYYDICKYLGEIEQQDKDYTLYTSSIAPELSIEEGENVRMVIISLLDHFYDKAGQQIGRGGKSTQATKAFVANLATMITLKAINLDSDKELDKIYDKIVPYIISSAEKAGNENLYDLRAMAIELAQARIDELNKAIDEQIAAGNSDLKRYPADLICFFDDVLQENQVGEIARDVKKLHCSYTLKGSTLPFSYVKRGSGENLFVTSDLEAKDRPNISSVHDAVEQIGKLMTDPSQGEIWIEKVLYAFNHIQNAIISDRPEEERAVDTHGEVMEMMLANMLVLKHIEGKVDDKDRALFDDRAEVMEEIFTLPLVQALSYQSSQLQMGKITREEYDKSFVNAYADFYNLGVASRDEFIARYDHYRKEQFSKGDVKAFLSEIVKTTKACKKSAGQTLSLYAQAFVDNGGVKKKATAAKRQVKGYMDQAPLTTKTVLGHPTTLSKTSQLLLPGRTANETMAEIESQFPQSMQGAEEYKLTHALLSEVLERIEALPKDEWHYKGEEPALEGITSGVSKAEALSKAGIDKESAQKLTQKRSKEFLENEFDDMTK